MKSFTQHINLKEETIRQRIDRLLNEEDPAGATQLALDALVGGEMKYSTINSIFELYSAFYRSMPEMKKSLKQHSKILARYRQSGVMNLTHNEVVEVFRDMHFFFKKHPNAYKVGDIY